MTPDPTDPMPADGLPSLGIHVWRAGDQCTLALDGELDLSSVDLLSEAIQEVRAGGAVRVIVDLSRLGFMDSSGMHALLTAASELGDDGRGLTIVPGHGRVQRALEVAGLVDVLPFAPPPPPTR